MSYVIKAIEFLKDNGKIISDNWYIFLIWTLLTIAITLLIVKFFNKKSKKRYDEIEAENEHLKEELQQQKEYYDSLETEAWLSASKCGATNQVAKNISQSVQKEYKCHK